MSLETILPVRVAVIIGTMLNFLTETVTVIGTASERVNRPLEGG